MNPQPISIRPAEDGDNEALTRLGGELGYEASARDTESRLARVERSASHRFFENRGFLPVKTQRVYEKLWRESKSKISEE